MAVQTTTQNHSYHFLRRVLQANGIFSTLSGILFIVDAGIIATFLGINAPGIIAFTGVILLAFAAGLFYLSLQESINRQIIYSVIASDIGWVVGSALLLFTNWLPLTTGGFWAVAIVADIVATFAILQWYGLRRK